MRRVPFPLPDYAPRLVRFAVDPAAGTAHYVSEMLLTDTSGTPLTGLPNIDGPLGMANADESAIDLHGDPLPFDPAGIDPEGVAVAADGSYWIVEEYRPSILHFDATGKLIRRFVPIGTNANPAGVNLGVEALPGVLMQRTTNHGFEAAVLDGSILYTFMQSPIDNPDQRVGRKRQGVAHRPHHRLDTTTETTVGQYVYLVDGGKVDKIRDAVALGDGSSLSSNMMTSRARPRGICLSDMLHRATNLRGVCAERPGWAQSGAGGALAHGFGARWAYAPCGAAFC